MHSMKVVLPICTGQDKKLITGTAALLNPTIIFGKCIGLLPVTIKKGNNEKWFEFEWKSFIFLYSVIMLIITAIVASMCIYHTVLQSSELSTAGNYVFYYYRS